MIVLLLLCCSLLRSYHAQFVQMDRQMLSRLLQSQRHKPQQPELHSEDNAETARCRNLYGQREFLVQSNSTSVEASTPPPLLYSLPGSGNTWTRLLIEYATGIYTGSMYNDDSLVRVLPGEFTCNTSVSVVKAHPSDFRYMTMFHSEANNNTKTPSHKCARLGNIFNFKRMVLISRHPLESLWAEYMRRSGKSHTGILGRSNFHMDNFIPYVIEAVKTYQRIYSFDYVRAKNELGPRNLLSIKYEDLRNTTTQIRTLHSVVQFLHLSNRSNAYNVRNDSDELDRVRCAFPLSENRQIHRAHDANSSQLQVTLLDGFFATSRAMTLLCSIWPNLIPILRTEGYSITEYSTANVTYVIHDVCLNTTGITMEALKASSMPEKKHPPASHVHPHPIDHKSVLSAMKHKDSHTKPHQ